MKKLPALLMVMTLLLMSIASSAHADCAEAGGCDSIQAVKSIDDSSDHDGDTQKAACDCCATCSHHNHSNATFLNGSADPIIVVSQTLHVQVGDTYFSQLQYPLSKPPKT